MNQRTQGKIGFYANLLKKLHIISEKEKQEILKRTTLKKAYE
jgi:DNA-directed RNA polymerase subunit H (RpoH/RPB5)